MSFSHSCKEEKSLRFHSHSSNRLVSTWWKTEYSDATSGAFAIVDFLLGSDMVDVAKVANGISEEAPITEGKNEIPTVTTTSAGTTTLQRSTAVQTTPEAPTARPTTLRARKTPASPGRAAEIATKGRSGKLRSSCWSKDYIRHCLKINDFLQLQPDSSFCLVLRFQNARTARHEDNLVAPKKIKTVLHFNYQCWWHTTVYCSYIMSCVVASSS